MILPSLALLCVGLCVGQGEWTIDESLLRPSISARPSSVVPAQSNVTLRCSAPARGVQFVFLKGKYSVDTLGFANSPEVLEELRLTDVPASAAGEYTCQYYRRVSPSRRSPPSDVLLLLVTGCSPKPSLQAHHGGNVTAGANVSLQCQQPRHATDFNMFALLKKGTPMPTQLRSQEGRQTDFTLQSVTVGDTGNYSCVYYQAKAPFWASEPSDQLEIWVTDKTEPPRTAGRTLGTTEIILIAAFAALFLLAAFLICKWICCGAALNKKTKRSCSSKKPEEVVTDASTAMMSRSPALDEGSQESRAEEPHGVTYAELNAKALREGPSSLVTQPLETCVYSTLKTQPGGDLDPGGTSNKGLDNGAEAPWATRQMGMPFLKSPM
ncbi:T-cell-interacting, activating receptor on myeloid cells protein 1-like [Pteronotus mesoamericanus]|uniref:T-cell-interacting, activating receptor on myeloid cells protein 1-like n=1 Tax=Pteronotus mesoamericanus TaxID=1884717 RepID=UPI0023EAFA22|nr:T-cell-interacting, activating receptor on myeloid cells protein 1-like [Pteronotus parnellii mesoamericanus]